jgi:hypothetical protein
MLYSLPRERCSIVSNRRQSKSIYLSLSALLRKNCNRKDCIFIDRSFCQELAAPSWEQLVFLWNPVRHERVDDSLRT